MTTDANDAGRSREAGTCESVAPPSGPVQQGCEPPEGEHELHHAAPPPATYRDWANGYRSLGTSPHIRRAIEKSLQEIGLFRRIRIDLRLRANALRMMLGGS